MKRKILVRALAVTFACATLLSGAACGKKPEEISKDPTVLNVKIRKAGYGTTYIEELAKQFEKTFEAEGYKVNVLAPREDLTSSNVMRDIWSDSGVDVYFSDGFSAQDLNEGEYGKTGSDITESVWNQKPIKFDGTEEELTIAEKLSRFDLSRAVYNEKIYGIPYACSFGVLAVNKKVLDSYELEIPQTTNEMFECAEVIMSDANDTGIFPFTFALTGNNYTNSTLAPWIAQAGGVEEFNSFMSFQDLQGNDMGKDSYKVFEYDSLEKALEVTYHFFDPAMAAYGSGTQEVDAAQGQIMKGTAVFYSVGDWFFNEEYTRNSKYRNDVVAVNAPLISTLGTELFTKYGFDAEKCDDVLSFIGKLATDGKLAEEIKPLVDAEFSASISIEDVTMVCQRRGITRNNMGAGLIISEKSPKKDLAAKFLRFCASTEAGSLFSEQARTSSPYSLDVPMTLDYPWIKSINKIAANPYFCQIQTENRGYKKALGLNTFLPNMGEVYAVDIYETGATKYDIGTLEVIGDNSVYANASKSLVATLASKAKDKLDKEEWKVVVK